MGQKEMNSKMADLNPTTTIITLNINGLSILFKRQRFSDRNKKHYNLTIDFTRDTL